MNKIYAYVIWFFKIGPKSCSPGAKSTEHIVNCNDCRDHVYSILRKQIDRDYRLAKLKGEVE